MTREIPLSKGYVAVVDDADYPLLATIKWCAKPNDGKVYACGRVGPQWKVSQRKRVLMHRLIMNAPSGTEVDHRDGNGLNNTRDNLRFATRTQNARNRRVQPHGLSRFKGVYAEYGKWVAKICANRKRRRLGTFATDVEAARAYDAAAKELHGGFARLNFPEAGA